MYTIPAGTGAGTLLGALRRSWVSMLSTSPQVVLEVDNLREEVADLQRQLAAKEAELKLREEEAKLLATTLEHAAAERHVQCSAVRFGSV